MMMRLSPFFQEMVRGVPCPVWGRSGSGPSDRLPFTPPTLPEPEPQLSVSELIVEAGKKRRGEPNKLDEADAIRRQQEGQ
jgi:hypothetical protein